MFKSTAHAQPLPQPVPITVAYGDGIGPEIMDATLQILREAGANLNIDTIEVGERIYKQGASSGILPSAWDSLKRTKVLLKAPITTPQGGGYKSLNVTIRKTLGLYANVRPTIAYAPFVKTAHPKMDLVIVRENEEDLYAGMEYRATDDSYRSVKLITRSGSERIIRYAFEYAVANGRKKVTCMSKDNIMKLADGAFHSIFDTVGKEYPALAKEHYIIDIGAARIASRPEAFDVIVTENLYGDIISDIAAEVSGSVGLAGSANIGEDFALFEAIHGSAPDIAGKGVANPSGLLLGGVMMLVHIGQPEVATRIHNGWLKTIEDGIHTGDIYGEHSTEKVGTADFAKAVIQRLGKKPSKLTPVSYKPSAGMAKIKVSLPPAADKKLVGVDVSIHVRGFSADQAGEKLAPLSGDRLELSMITCKGLKVWPQSQNAATVTDFLRCRFKGKNEAAVTHDDVAALLTRVSQAKVDFTKAEMLYTFDGQPGYTLGQGE